VEARFRNNKEIEYELLRNFMPNELIEETEVEADSKTFVDMTRVNEPGYLEGLAKANANIINKTSLNEYVAEEREQANMFLYFKHALPDMYAKFIGKGIEETKEQVVTPRKKNVM
jgi:hypothetical protein